MSDDKLTITVYPGEGSAQIELPADPPEDLAQDLRDCTSPGPCDDAVAYVLRVYKPEFRVIRRRNMMRYAFTMSDGAVFATVASAEHVAWNALTSSISGRPALNAPVSAIRKVSATLIDPTEPHEYANEPADGYELERCAREIYPDSDAGFADEDVCKAYLLWGAAHNWAYE